MIITQEQRKSATDFNAELKELRDALDKKYAQREVMILGFYERGHSVAELARLFDMQYQNVSKIIARHKKKD